MSENFKINTYPEKSWSISKMKVIESCLREYYYTYYGSHNGWLYESGEEQKVSWRLKKLTNIWILFGEKLHLLIKELIKDNKRERTVDELKEAMRGKLNLAVKESIEKYRRGEWDRYPKGEMLQEYYYGDKLSESSVANIKDRIGSCAESFLKSKSYSEVRSSAQKILEVDEDAFEYIMLYGVKVFSLIDLLYVDKDGNYVIVDWKTGKFSEHDREQLLVYVLYVMEKYKVPLDKIIGRVEYLFFEDMAEYRFSDSDIQTIKDRINMDLNVIDAFLEDKNLNKPRGKEYFPECDDLNKCKKCKFRKLCLNQEESKDEINRYSSVNK